MLEAGVWHEGAAMAQSDKGGGRSKQAKPPATLFEFPQSGPRSDSHRPEEFSTLAFTLSPNEQALYDELIKTARALDRRQIPGVYAHVADVVEHVSALKAQGANAVPALARGLDQLKAVSSDHRAKKLKSWRSITSDGREGPMWSIWFLLGAVGALIAGIAGVSDWYYISAFLFACAVACMVPTFWDIYTGK